MNLLTPSRKSYLPPLKSARKLGLGLVMASLFSGATVHAQLYVNDGFNGVTEYSLDGTQSGSAQNILYFGSQGMGVTDGSVYVSQYNQTSVAVLNPSTLASTQLSLVNTDSSPGNNPDGGFTAGGGDLYVDNGTNLIAYSGLTGTQDALFSPITTGVSGTLAYTNGDLFVAGPSSVKEYNGSTGEYITSITDATGALAASGDLLFIASGTDLYSYNLASDVFTDLGADTSSSAKYLAATSDALFVSEGSSVLKYDLTSDGTVATLDSSFTGVSNGAGAITALDVPEPSSVALVILGLGSLFLILRRRGSLSS